MPQYKKPVNGEKLIPGVVKAVIGRSSIAKETQPLSIEGRRNLQRAIKMDVDEWRSQFAAKLRETGEELLELTRQELQDIPPAARAYTLAVLIDKSQVLEGKNALQNSQVNVQINNFGSMSREEIMRKLSGQFDPVAPVAAEPVDVQAETSAENQDSKSSPENPG